jgi:thioredoxin 1
MAYITVSDADFQKTVLDEKKPVLVDFWAPWCGPCKMVGPVIEELAEEYKDKIVVAKVNVDDNPDSAGTYGVMSIPTIAFFKNGQIVKTLIGAQPKDSIKSAIQEIL